MEKGIQGTQGIQGIQGIQEYKEHMVFFFRGFDILHIRSYGFKLKRYLTLPELVLRFSLLYEYFCPSN
jgi:hypothetical protein